MYSGITDFLTGTAGISFSGCSFSSSTPCVAKVAYTSLMSWGMSDTATVLFERCDATISVVSDSSSFWLNFSVIFPRMPDAVEMARRILAFDVKASQNSTGKERSK